MARLPRLALAGHVHYVVQRGHNGGAIVADDEDRRSFFDALRDATRAHDCLLHAYALGETEAHLLLLPSTDAALSRTMQALGRRYAARFNQRHGRSGALWDGRYRATIVEPGDALLTALRLLDSGAALLDAGEPPREAGAPVRTSAGQRTGAGPDAAVTDPPEYWRLGNTPFEREVRYRELLTEAVAQATRLQLRHAVMHGWAYGSARFLAIVAAKTSRPLRPRPRGRPAKARASV